MTARSIAQQAEKSTPGRARGAAKREHGEHRPVHVVMLHDDRFHGVSVLARWLFVDMKLRFGPAGIGQVRVGVLAEATRETAETVTAALAELAEIGFVRRDGNVTWIREYGLDWEPSLTPNNPLHRKMIGNAVKALPDSQLVEEFTARHSEWLVGEPSAESEAEPDTVSDTVRHTVSDTLTKHDNGTDTETSTFTEKTPSRFEGGAISEATAETESIYLRELFPDAVPEVIEEKRREARALLSRRGVKFRGSVVKAAGEVHYRRCLAHVIKHPPDKPGIGNFFLIKHAGETYLEALAEQDKSPARQNGGLSRIDVPLVAVAGRVS